MTSSDDQTRQTEWIITVDDEHLDHLDDVVASLKRAGLTVDQVLATLGQICGRAQYSQRTTFAAVSGVASVSAAQRHRIAPPEAEVQ